MSDIKYETDEYGYIRFNEYNEPTYDKTKFSHKLIKDFEIGNYIIIKGHVCKVLHKSVGGCGKHGWPKVFIRCIGVFDDKIREDIIPATHEKLEPIVTFSTYEFVSRTDKEVELYDPDTNLIISVEISNELDIQVIQQINKYISDNVNSNNNDSNKILQIQVVKFDSLIRVVKVIV